MTFGPRGIASIAVLLAATACSWFGSSDSSTSLGTIWRNPVGAYARGTPAVVGNRLIQPFGDRIVRSFDVRTGAQLWQSAESEQGLYPVVTFVGPDSIAVVSAATSVRGYAISTGALRWVHRPAPDSSYDGLPGGLADNTLAINAAATVVAVPAWGSTVTAVRIATGDAIWTWSAGRDNARRHGAQGAVWCDNQVFVSLWRFIDERGLPSEHSVAALDGNTGQELWRVVLPFTAQTVSANGWMECDASRVWVTTQGGPLWALSRADGHVVWSQPRDRGYLNNAGPRRTQSRVFADAGLREQVVAYQADGGQELWRSSMVGAPYLRMVGGAEFLWVTDGAFLYVYRAADGQRVIYQRIDEKGISNPPLLLNERDAILPMENGIARVQLKTK